MRELRRTAEATVARIEAARELRAAGGERRVGELAVGPGGGRGGLGGRRHERIVLLVQLGRVVAVIPGNALQDVLECRQAVARFLREVGAAEERPPIIVGEEHRERPATTALRQHLLRDLVDAIDVRTLLAIDFDVDEVVVEDPGGGFVLEAFFMEDGAPVTGRISYAQMNRLFFPTRALESFGSPWIPVNGIVRVFPEIRARLGSEAVGVLLV